MLETLYQALKYNEFNPQGRCKCCIGDKWVGHATWCKVGLAIAEYENLHTRRRIKVNEIYTGTTG